jgi:hypothetical protein
MKFLKKEKLSFKMIIGLADFDFINGKSIGQTLAGRAKPVACTINML